MDYMLGQGYQLLVKLQPELIDLIYLQRSYQTYIYLLRSWFLEYLELPHYSLLPARNFGCGLQQNYWQLQQQHLRQFITESKQTPIIAVVPVIIFL